MARNKNDEVGRTVLCRLEVVNDLVTEEARCHTDYQVHFLPGRQLRGVVGRRGGEAREEKHSAFLKLCNQLDQDDECQYSQPELEVMMDELLDGKPGDYRAWLKQRLEARYKSDIVITCLNGVTSVVCFKDKAYCILNEKWLAQRNEHPQGEIIDMAAMLVRNAIRTTAYETCIPRYNHS